MTYVGEALRVLKACFTFAEEFPRLDFVRYVLRRNHDADQRALVVRDPFGNGSKKAHFAVLPDNSELQFDRSASRINGTFALQDLLPVSRINTVDE